MSEPIFESIMFAGFNKVQVFPDRIVWEPTPFNKNILTIIPIKQIASIEKSWGKIILETLGGKKITLIISSKLQTQFIYTINNLVAI